MNVSFDSFESPESLRKKKSGVVSTFVDSLSMSEPYGSEYYLHEFINNENYLAKIGIGYDDGVVSGDRSIKIENVFPFSIAASILNTPSSLIFGRNIIRRSPRPNQWDFIDRWGLPFFKENINRNFGRLQSTPLLVARKLPPPVFTDICADIAIDFIRICSMYKGSDVALPTKSVKEFLDYFASNEGNPELYKQLVEFHGLPAKPPHTMPVLDPTDESEAASLANARAWIGASALDGQAISFAPNAARSILSKTPRLPEPSPDGTYDNGKVYIPNLFAIDHEIYIKNSMKFATDGNGLVCLYGAENHPKGMHEVTSVPGISGEFLERHPELFDIECKDARKQVALVGYGKYGIHVDRAEHYFSKKVIHDSAGG
jgi:hypothetical protein